MLNVKRLVLIAGLIALAQTPEHAQRISKARIQPLPASEWTDAHRQALGSMAQGDRTIDVFKTCLRNVELCRSWMVFTQYVLSENNSLPRRERELLILRASWNCKADYDWAHHVAAAKRAGLGDEEIQRIARSSMTGWNEPDATLLRAADELHKDQHIGDATWNALAARYNDRQLMDIVFTVGQYTMVSMFLNSAGVQLEPGFTGLPKQ